MPYFAASLEWISSSGSDEFADPEGLRSAQILRNNPAVGEHNRVLECEDKSKKVAKESEALRNPNL